MADTKDKIIGVSEALMGGTVFTGEILKNVDYFKTLSNPLVDQPTDVGTLHPLSAPNHLVQFFDVMQHNIESYPAGAVAGLGTFLEFVIAGVFIWNGVKRANN